MEPIQQMKGNTIVVIIKYVPGLSMCSAGRTSSRKMTAWKHGYGHLCDGFAYQMIFDIDAGWQAFKIEQYLAHVGAGILKKKTKNIRNSTKNTQDNF